MCLLRLFSNIPWVSHLCVVCEWPLFSFLANLFNRVKPNRHALKMVHASHLLTIIQVSGSGPPMKLRVSLTSLNHLSKTVVGRRKKELERWAEEQFRDVLDKFCVVMGNPRMHDVQCHSCVMHRMEEVPKQNVDEFHPNVKFWISCPVVQRSTKRRGCLQSYSQAEPGRELTQPRRHLFAEPCRKGEVEWRKRANCSLSVWLSAERARRGAEREPSRSKDSSIAISINPNQNSYPVWEYFCGQTWGDQIQMQQQCHHNKQLGLNFRVFFRVPDFEMRRHGKRGEREGAGDAFVSPSLPISTTERAIACRKCNYRGGRC